MSCGSDVGPYRELGRRHVAFVGQFESQAELQLDWDFRVERLYTPECGQGNWPR